MGSRDRARREATNGISKDPSSRHNSRSDPRAPAPLGYLRTGLDRREVCLDPQRAHRPEILGVQSRDPARAKAFAEKVGIPNSFAGNDMIADPKIDVVYVALS